MKEDLISFETAKLAKEKGFKNGSISTYHDDGALNIHYSNGKRVNGDSNMTNGIEAPTQSLLQKWLREVHEIIIYVIPSYIEDESLVYKCNGFDNYIQVQRQTYEEALEIGLQEALTLI